MDIIMASIQGNQVNALNLTNVKLKHLVWCSYADSKISFGRVPLFS
jgi:hypothetical protein